MDLIKRLKDRIAMDRLAPDKTGGSAREQTPRRRPVKLLAAFFAVMAALTVLSRIADTWIVAKVEVAQPHRGALTYEIEGQGRIESRDEVSVDSAPDLRVDEVFVEAGQEVRAGDSLVAFDTGDIGEQLYLARCELTKLELQKMQQGPGEGAGDSAVEDAREVYANAQEDALTGGESAGRAVERAQKDYDEANKAYKAAQKNERQLNAADRQQAVNSAQEALDAAQDEYDTAVLARDSALVTVQRAVEDARDALDAAESGGDPAAIDAAQKALNRALEDQDTVAARQDQSVTQAQGRLTAAQEALDAVENASYDAGTRQVREARGARENARRALQDAKDAQAVQGTSAQRDLECARRQIESAQSSAADESKQADIQRQSIDIDIAIKTREVGALEALESNHIVAAPADGTVLSVEADIGDRTTGGEILRIAAHDGGYRFRAQIGEEEAGYVAIGDTVEITIRGEEHYIEGEIESILVRGDEGIAEITASLPEGEYTVGISATMEIGKRSESYNTCLPLEAVCKDTKGDYILVVRESNTVLGKEYTAVRIPVTVLDHDAANAAVTGALMSGDMVITGSNKPVDYGDRVRLGE